MSYKIYFTGNCKPTVTGTHKSIYGEERPWVLPPTEVLEKTATAQI